MTFKGDIHQTRVKNSSSRDTNFSVPARAICLIFFCWKEHVRMQDMPRRFFLNSYFLCEKKSDKFNDSKNAPKMGVYLYISIFIIIKTKLNLKKRPRHVVHLDMLFQTNKKMKDKVRARTEKFGSHGRKSVSREKTKNILSFL